MSKDFNLRPYELSDHDMLADWWVKQGWPVIAPASLPKIGLVAMSDKPVCAGFLFQTDSNIAWSELIVADPESNIEDRDLCLDLLIIGLTKQAKFLGFGVVFTTLTHKRLIARYEKHGYNKTDQDVTNMICQLGV